MNNVKPLSLFELVCYFIGVTKVTKIQSKNNKKICRSYMFTLYGFIIFIFVVKQTKNKIPKKITEFVIINH